MGNLPAISRKSSEQFGEYNEATKGTFSLRPFRPYDMSFEDLRPVLSRMQKGRSWVDEGGNGGGDGATILGLEMDQDVCLNNI